VKRQRVRCFAKHLHLYTSKHLISSLFRAGNERQGIELFSNSILFKHLISSLFRAGNSRIEIKRGWFIVKHLISSLFRAGNTIHKAGGEVKNVIQTSNFISFQSRELT